ncbi:MAG: methylmalonyl Co-A mutase-associated GTPase MeaB [Acidimicrobiia bacterium]
MTDAPELLADGVIAGDRRSLARAITLVESTSPDHRGDAIALLNTLHRAPGSAIRIGISGAPGAGKSTLIEAFGLHLIEQGNRVAVLAVDPSSQRTGGSILGDKTRMEQLARKSEAFVRPSPSGGALGGVARRTREAMTCCEAAGFDFVLIETVGVGQSETAVADMVDVFVLVVSPGGGDELQGIKRGIMELADIVAVNKADGDMLPAAREAAGDYGRALHFLRPRVPNWTPQAILVSSIEHTGIDTLSEAIGACVATQDADGVRFARRHDQDVHWMWAEVFDSLTTKLRATAEASAHVDQIEAAVRAGELSPAAAAAKVLEGGV